LNQISQERSKAKKPSPTVQAKSSAAQGREGGREVYDQFIPDRSSRQHTRPLNTLWEDRTTHFGKGRADCALSGFTFEITQLTAQHPVAACLRLMLASYGALNWLLARHHLCSLFLLMLSLLAHTPTSATSGINNPPPLQRRVLISTPYPTHRRPCSTTSRRQAFPP